jgi:hypothetical protein
MQEACPDLVLGQYNLHPTQPAMSLLQVVMADKEEARVLAELVAQAEH